MNIKSTAILMLTSLTTVACALPEQKSVEVLDFRDPAIPYYAEWCKEGTITGHGMGYSNCVDVNLQRTAIARASGGETTYTAALR